MRHHVTRSITAGAAALAFATMLPGCSTPDANGSLSSVHQPVVERSEYRLDLVAAGGQLAPGERERLGDWFAALGLQYGDRITVAGAGDDTRGEIAATAGRYGVVLGEASEPVDPAPAPGLISVLVGRSRAYVPGCPDWSAASTAKLDNATSSNFGCAINSNLAAMVADPEHLLKGAEGTGETAATTASKAIATYRAAEPSGAGGLSEVSSQSEGSEQ